MTKIVAEYCSEHGTILYANEVCPECETVEQTVARVLNEMYGTCMLAGQVRPVLEALEKEGLVLVPEADVQFVRRKNNG